MVVQKLRGCGVAGLQIVSFAMLALLGSAEQADAMQRYVGKNRPVVIFAPAPDSRKLTQQRKVFAGKTSALRERDIVVISVIGNQLWSWLGLGPALTTEELRQRFGVGRNDFRVVLVGKDGGVKVSSPEPLSAERLFEAIDAMPMRRREMQGR